MFLDEKSAWAQVPKLKTSKRSSNAENKIIFWEDRWLRNFTSEKM